MQRMSPLYNQSIGNNVTYDVSNNLERLSAPAKLLVGLRVALITTFQCDVEKREGNLSSTLQKMSFLLGVFVLFSGAGV